MQALYARCCGMDVHKKTVVACVLLQQPDGAVQRQIRTFSTMTADLLTCLDWLESLQVEAVAMESTGVYWRPISNILEGHLIVFLVNAQHMKAVPGRKTDVKDSEWIADLLRHGLLQPSFLPPAPIREVRELTRYRKSLVGERVQEINRLQKVLETANLKLASVASNVVGVSGRKMLEALIDGQRDPEVLADLARGRLREKIPELRRALDGRLQSHQSFLLQEILVHLEFLESAIERLEKEIEQRLGPFEEEVKILESLPVELQVGAAVVIAEIGTDMSRFASAKHLASWAGVCPGNKVSAGKRLSGKSNKGNRHLRALLCQLAWTIVRSSEPSSLKEQYHRIARRRGKKRAILAVAHSLLDIIYVMLRDKKVYEDLGADFFERNDAQQLQGQAVARLERLGYEVTLKRRGEVA